MHVTGRAPRCVTLEGTRHGVFCINGAISNYNASWVRWSRATVECHQRWRKCLKPLIKTGKLPAGKIVSIYIHSRAHHIHIKSKNENIFSFEHFKFAREKNGISLLFYLWLLVRSKFLLMSISHLYFFFCKLPIHVFCQNHNRYWVPVIVLRVVHVWSYLPLLNYMVSSHF